MSWRINMTSLMERFFLLFLCYYIAEAGKKVKVPYKREFGTRIVNPHNFTFLHQPKACEPHQSLLVTVHSATQNYAKRMALRNTWANPEILRDFLPEGFRSKLVFVIGWPKSNESLQSSISYEAETYEDIIQANFIDHYRNNTYKAIYNMKWISSRGGCSKVKLIIKSDDDVMFNVKKMSLFWKKLLADAESELQPEKPFIGGNLFGGGPRRNPKDKWYISVEQFKYDEYPPWFQGMVYFLTPCVARQIYELSFTSPYLFTDDVYIGIVSDRVENIRRINLVTFYNNAFSSLVKNMNSWVHKPAVFYHNAKIRDMYKLWHLTCSTGSCSNSMSPFFEISG
ncbi:beta-1,3-galactosyltransferase 1-like [Watersipora subatra]|uniref:beta-1,3-galactosyltransferase 1-like n=1 Tax=Watersipora subatra TaxID=2589382 RepID=UPI00355B0CA1